ncbi:MAG: hypothetical protein NC200_06525, partial [Candidatus Gastranaerophilales bacterium]|nr:hypothetical protein [Candidatus Gastranaerophilales bacterium]
MKKIITILLFLLYFSNIPAFSQDILENFSDYIYDGNITLNYNRIERSTWNKYFKAQAKIIKKNWRKNKSLFSPKYKTSYARVLIAVDKNGEILSYKIKSSCVPTNDEIFINQVKKTINSIGKFDNLPSNYRYNILIFTVKLHSK